MRPLQDDSSFFCLCHKIFHQQRPLLALLWKASYNWGGEEEHFSWACSLLASSTLSGCCCGWVGCRAEVCEGKGVGEVRVDAWCSPGLAMGDAFQVFWLVLSPVLSLTGAMCPLVVIHRWLQGITPPARGEGDGTICNPLLLSHLVMTSEIGTSCLLLRTEGLFPMHGELKGLPMGLLVIFLTPR